MVKIGMIAVVVGVAISVAVAIYYYDEFQVDLIYVDAGEAVQVGPVRYVIEYEGTHGGNEENTPDNVFVKIRIRATNLGEEETRMSGGQFHIIDENDRKTQPVFGEFSDEDLLDYYLQPGKESTWTTQFDIPFDEDGQYKIGIIPTKIQSSQDIGIVCLLNCPSP